MRVIYVWGSVASKILKIMALKDKIEISNDVIFRITLT